MKPTFTIILILILFSSVFSQTKRTTIAEDKVGPVHCLYQRNIDIDKGDTVDILYFGFQNAKYSSISDIKSIGFDALKDTASIFQFVKDLKSAYKEMGAKTAISWDREKYVLDLYDWANTLYLRPEKNESGYCLLNKNKVLELYTWIENIGFKK